MIGLYYYILISIISALIDEMYGEKCTHPQKYLVSVPHHFMSMYTWFGGILFDYPRFHLFYTLVLMTTWIIYRKCILNPIYNNMCNLPEKTPFKDIFYYMFADPDNDAKGAFRFDQIMRIPIIIFIDLFRIYNTRYEC